MKFFIRSQPQIIDSLFAIRIFLLDLIISKVGFKPEIPGMAEIVKSDLLIFFKLKLFKILFFYKFFY